MRRRRRRTTVIKSNNPHLAGGEKTTSFIHDHGISQVEMLILKRFQPDPAPFGDNLDIEAMFTFIICPVYQHVGTYSSSTSQSMNDTAGDCTSKFRREHVQKHKRYSNTGSFPLKLSETTLW